MSDLATTLATVLEEAIDAKLTGLNVMLPGKVVRVDVPGGKCDVQPLIKIKYGDETVEDMPVITNVPIANYRAGTAFISLPVHVGDTVELRFSQRSIDVWKSKGGSVDPQDPRKFHLSDCVAYPGMYPLTDPPTGATADDIVIKNGTATLIVKESTLELFGNSDAIALASKVLTELGKIKTAYDTHVHPGVTSGLSSTSPPASPMPAPASVASTKVKAE